MSFRRLLLALAVLLSVLGCRDRDRPSTIGQEIRQVLAPKPPVVTAPRTVQRLELMKQLPYCQVRHRGITIDTGSSWSSAHRSFALGPFNDVEFRSRAGHRTGAVLGRKLSYDFWLQNPAKSVHIALRVQGKRGRHLTLYVDGKRIGQRRLSGEASRVFDFGPLQETLEPGRHTFLLRFSGRGKPDSASALIDWIRVYVPDQGTQVYAPSTKQTVLHDVSLGGQPLRSLALRSPGSVRCAFFPNRDSRLVVDVGYWGDGEGRAQVIAQLGGGQSVVLAEREVVGGEKARWQSLDLSLESLDDKLVALEFAAAASSKSGRVVFGEPRLESGSTPPRSVQAKNVVVVVGAGMSRHLQPPWGARTGLPNLFALAEEGVAFDNYRAVSPMSGAVMATLLTGLRPSQHQLLDLGSRIRRRLPLISETLRESGASTAFFTNVPYSFEGFGFNQHWGQFRQTSPVQDQPATAPLLQAKQWLEKELEERPERSRLLVVHTRAAHPPWDITPEELAVLPPAEYLGILEPRRGAIVLRDVRQRRQRSRRKLGPRDWQRLEAMQLEALHKQDTALGALTNVLREAGQWEQTLLIWLGDVGRGDAPTVPFKPSSGLTESRLTPPLVVKFPGAKRPGSRSSAAVDTRSISATLHDALGAALPKSLESAHLGAAVSGAVGPSDPGVLVTHGSQYAYFLGPWRVSGVPGNQPRLCDLLVDPACATDLAADRNFEMEWLWRRLIRAWELEMAEEGAQERESAAIDDDTAAALSVFGL